MTHTKTKKFPRNDVNQDQLNENLAKLRERAIENSETLTLMEEPTTGEVEIIDDIKSIIILSLIEDETDIQICNMLLFHKWMIMLHVNGQANKNIISQWDKLAPMLMKISGDTMQSATSKIEDKDSNKEFKLLGQKIEMMKQYIYSQGLKQLTKEEADSQWQKASDKIDNVMYPIIEKGQFNEILERTFFYSWYRFFAIAKNIPEEEFQKAERNWHQIYTYTVDVCLKFLKSKGC